MSNQDKDQDKHAQPIAGESLEVIDTPEFMDLLNKFAHESSCEEYNEAEYKSARDGIASYIRTYGQQCHDAALEKAARKCVDISMHDHAYEFAAAIRALKGGK